MPQGKRLGRSGWAGPVLLPAAVLSLHSPLGELFVAASATAIVATGFEENHFLEELMASGYEAVSLGANTAAVDLARQARRQLEEYFAGRRLSFDVPISFGTRTPFSTAVLEEVRDRVPFGVTVSYGEVGERAGRLAAARAVGNVLASCPFSVVVPCHRVVHACRPFGAGTATAQQRRKQWLLRFEQELPRHRTAR